MIKQKYSIYVHIPFCKARCGYCAFSSCTDFGLVERYFERLFEEIEYYGDKKPEIYTVYIGGGTPSSVDKNLLNDLFDKLRVNFDLSKVVEVTVECNPESATEELLRCLKANGVNRLSFGLQSVNDATLKRIGRLHDFKQFEKALKLARQLGFENINADLIVGLPETKEEFYRSVEVVGGFNLQHVSIYALELHEGTPLYNLCKAEYHFDDDEMADMYDKACEILFKCGLERYEISNFARKGQESKHNLNYWQEGRYFAFGASASGFVGDVRYTNPYEIKQYLSTPVKLLHNDCEKLTGGEQANEFVMLGLRLMDGVSLEEFEARYSVDFFVFFPNARKLVELGLLRIDSGRVTVPPDKLYVVNSILVELLII
ncbi:MAG: radical SAM family heme chaperone HemW [Clostridiales bacterium]|nr:radical SAM family heme chaperone HemW [Clostridiales bacterium]